MGNNMGRSQACKTCLKRRVKCDLTRPICTRCSKSNLVCLGYRETLFIDARDQVIRRLERASTSPTPKTSTYLQATKSRQTPIRTNPQRKFIFRPSQIPQSLSISGMKDSHVLSYLTVNACGPIELICRSLASPSYHADSLQQSARKQSFLALATTFYGLGHMEESIIHDGRRLYGGALKMVNTSVQEPSGQEVIETLSSVLALCLHEAIAPTQTTEHGWLRHIDGLEQLLATQNPMAIKNDPVSNALLEVTRPMMIVAALYARRPSLMAKSEWRASNNKTNGHYTVSSSTHNTTLPKLWDILAQIPSLYHELDHLPSPETTQSLVQDILDQTQFVLTSLSLLPTALSPSSTTTLSSGIRILLSKLTLSLTALLPPTPQTTILHTRSSAQISNATHKIIQTATTPPSLHSTTDSDTTNFALLLPLRIAHTSLISSEDPEDVQKRETLERVLQEVKQRGGTWMGNRAIWDVRKRIAPPVHTPKVTVVT